MDKHDYVRSDEPVPQTLQEQKEKFKNMAEKSGAEVIEDNPLHEKVTEFKKAFEDYKPNGRILKETQEMIAQEKVLQAQERKTLIEREEIQIDFTRIYREKGFKYKYVYTVGNLDKPETVEIVDCWEREELTTDELEQQKRHVMRGTGKPIVNIDIEEI
ncbi:hypothetical protein FRY98_24385 [Paenibacillus faecis]|uniref:Uncharacterized protein n=1 Tax=Paenibacillus faecis TaxID=862114 RepID=A0A5D0CM18_9BACL|nr:hypothetical protein [Paenibacillus faecis]TYA10911.1 hypothetical protein FRY98_24385 [Paenibacillus faecis]